MDEELAINSSSTRPVGYSNKCNAWILFGRLYVCGAWQNTCRR